MNKSPPILVIQHMDNGGPEYFAEHVTTRGKRLVFCRPDLGEALPAPAALGAFSAICLCGGIQSLCDDLPWLREETELVRGALLNGMPVIGHCLGGQVMSVALGGAVKRHPLPEFGWQPLHREPGPQCEQWLPAEDNELVAMQWHYDSFTVPPGATPLLAGVHCRHQAFIHGRSLAMQFHVEVTAWLVRHWARDLAHLAPAPGPSVQTPAQVLDGLEHALRRSQQLARRLYDTWLEQVP